jgi:hypothetical protein
MTRIDLTIDEIKKYASHRILTLTGQVAAFAASVASDAVSALGDCDDDFRRVAELHEWMMFLKSLDVVELKDVIAGRRTYLIGLARLGCRSTSATSNLMAQYRLAALATVLRDIGELS